MSVTTPAMGTASATSGRTWYRFVRRLALRASSELALVYVPDGVHEQLAVLKRLPPAHTADAAAVAKFRREARIAARLEHPSIVRVFDVVESSREDFYTMEYVRGADMRQLMDALSAQGRTLPLDCVLLIALEVCNALDYAHHLTDDRGKPAPVIHRELSPSKVLVGVDGAIKLTGFGAPPVEQSAALRRSRTASVSYTSPERALGEGVDARSDVFALGVLLWELSTGERLFADATSELQVMEKVMRGEMPRPSELRRAYPRELEAILMKALAKERRDRYQTAAQLQSEIETFLWSRWPTASTSALAKLVSTMFPTTEAADLATGTTERERITPASTSESVLWLGPVPLAKPYPRPVDVLGARTSKKDLASNAVPAAAKVDVALGAPGSRRPFPRGSKPMDMEARGTAPPDTVRIANDTDRATTVDEMAVPVEADSGPVTDVDHDVGEMVTVMRRRGPDGTLEPPLARGHYQRPLALDEQPPERVPTPASLARAEIAKLATPVVLVRSDLPRTPKEPEPATAVDPAQAVTASAPAPDEPRPVSPLPAALVAQRRWTVPTLVAVACAVVVGVLVSVLAIKRTVHEPEKLPVAYPAPPREVVVTGAPRLVPPPPAEHKPIRARARAAASKKPPAERADELAGALPVGSLDGLPSIRALEVHHVAALPVRKAVEATLSPLRGCYRAAARARQLTPQIDLTIAFSIDHRRAPVKVRAVGGGALDTLAACAAKVTSAIRDLPAPTGPARVTVTLQFRPNP